MPKRRKPGGRPRRRPAAREPRPPTPCLSPCRECPFKRDSLKGYVGGHANSAEILQIVHFDGKFPCHMAVTRLVEGEPGMAFDEAVEAAPHCAGSLAYRNNTCKAARDAETAGLMREVGRRDDVFRGPVEMMLYHDDGVARMLTPPGQPMPVVPEKQVRSYLERTKDV